MAHAALQGAAAGARRLLRSDQQLCEPERRQQPVHAPDPEGPVGSVTFRFLVSFHYHQRTNLQEIVDAYDGPCEVFADSGAFSAATQNVTISLKDYTAWLKDWDGLLTVKATLDVIGDPEATARNTAALERQGLKVLPVF